MKDIDTKNLPEIGGGYVPAPCTDPNPTPDDGFPRDPMSPFDPLTDPSERHWT